MSDDAKSIGEQQIALANEQILYARVVRPPWLAWDGAAYCGARLLSVDESSLAGIAGIVRVVVQCNFVAVVATDDAQAALGARRLQVAWSQQKLGLTGQSGDLSPALSSPQKSDNFFAHGAALIEHSYAWSPAPAAPVSTWALAWYGDREVTVWMPQPAASHAQHALRTELALLLNIPASAVTLIGADDSNDTAADAALLSQILKQPVQVAFVPSQGEAPGLHFVSHISAAFDANKHLSAYRYLSSPLPQAAPALALLLTGMTAAIDDATFSDATQSGMLPPYAYPHLHVGGDGTALPKTSPPLPIASSATIENAATHAAVFAHESFVTEAALQAGGDPVAYRLQHLDDARGAKLIASVAQQGDWQPQSAVDAASETASKTLLAGRGFAYAHVVENQAGKTAQSWSAWIADVAYDSDSGDISVTRVIVGQDASLSDNAGAPTITQQLEGDAIDAARLLLQNAPSFDTWGSDTAAAPADGALSLSGGKLPLRPDSAASELAPRSTQLAGGGAFSLPAAAAVANAIYDATGVRLREPPFSGERIRLALATNTDASQKSTKKWLMTGVAMATAFAGLVTLAFPWRTAIAPIAPPDPTLYSAATIARGRLVAAAGDCMVCHTAPNGIKNAGGLPLDTPFGTIYSTNITPDAETGIGNWSYAAFERAMREGIHRDGKHLYPAFPYTAFAKTSDADLQALYA
ncbi:MAG: putative cytochrome, partial [Herbaspirillum sp.]|nr:putative cytochrome [Herbaspirillum sp.]